MPSKFSGVLVETLSVHLEPSRRRLATLAGLMLLLVNIRTVSLPHVAAQFSATANAASTYRHLQRFFQFVRLDGQVLVVLSKGARAGNKLLFPNV